MTGVPYLCPACLTELPAGYPYDHVAIDQALAGNRQVFSAMDDDERREVIQYGRRTGMTDFAISARLHRSLAFIRAVASGTPPARQPAKGAHDADIRELWARGLSDRAIAARLGFDVSNVRRTRTRLQLPANYSAIGQPVRHLEAA
jgi:DNA-binding NarL/FixJ family response regulator